jgi:hypothetical protein
MTWNLKNVPAWPVLILSFILGLWLLAGCSNRSINDAQAAQLAQAQADVVATAVVANRTPNLPTQLIDLINADLGRINAALANVPNIPAPAVAAVTLAADPVACTTEAKSASDAAKNPPSGSWINWATVTAGAALAFVVLKQVAPFIPYVGPAWAAIINAGYAIAQHADEKAVDAATTKVQQAAVIAKPVLESVRALAPAGSITPAIAQALDTLAAATPAKGT